MINSNQFLNKEILLIDREPKNKNDRTWCFWEKENGFFQPIVYHQWSSLELKREDENILLNTDKYVYKMIRGIDFYNHCFNLIKVQKNIKVQYGEVTNIDAENGVVTMGETNFIGTQIFSSVLLEPPVLKPIEFYLLQHFRGWWIETDHDYFDAKKADLMDFRTPQNHGCTFVYVLPINKRKALIEYTLFSEEKLEDAAYNNGLERFIADKLNIKNYHIVEIENGVIPMTNLNFKQQKYKVFFIGTAGGQTKASTGYTFQFIQKQTAAIVDSLIKVNKVFVTQTPSRFNFYDSVLLRILSEKKLLGADIFFNMFKKNKAIIVFKFLDNETNLFEELKLMNSMDKTTFIPAALKEI